MGYNWRPFNEDVIVHLSPGLMKGPNATLPFVDEMPNQLKIDDMRNVPLPLKDALRVLQSAFGEIKALYFQNFNNLVTTQRVVNMNQQQARTDVTQNRREAQENIELCDQYREQRLADTLIHVEEVLAKKQEEIEDRSALVINQRIKEELVMLR